jgi:serine/threonine protein kinase
MARLGDINPQATRFTSTMCPGTDVYMPPESVKDKPVYTEKIDCFSFDVIIVQILTRQFPKPGDRLQEEELNHPGLPPGKLLVQAPEVNRRNNHISQVDPNHSLLPIALDCLNGWLTTIGGYSYPSYSNELFSLTGEGSDRRWTKKSFHPCQQRGKE